LFLELAALELDGEPAREPAEAPADLDRARGAAAFAFVFVEDVFFNEDVLGALPFLAVFLLEFTLVGIRSL